MATLTVYYMSVLRAGDTGQGHIFCFIAVGGLFQIAFWTGLIPGSGTCILSLVVNYSRKDEH